MCSTPIIVSSVMMRAPETFSRMRERRFRKWVNDSDVSLIFR